MIELAANGFANGLAHGFANGLAHGFANGLAHGFANGLARRVANGLAMRDLAVPSAMFAAATALWLMPHRRLIPRRARPARQQHPTIRRLVLAASGAVAVGLLLNLSPVAIAGLAVAVVAGAFFARTRQRPLSTGEMRYLAGVFDLFAACLDAGLPANRALAAALRARQTTAQSSPHSTARSTVKSTARDGAVESESPRGTDALISVSALLELGTNPASAWQATAAYSELTAIAVAARRSSLGGVRLADAARETATDLRRQCRAQMEQQAARAGVTLTAPLTLCFLPAFICLGVAPVIIGLVGSLQLW